LFEKHKPPQTRLSSSSQLECDPKPRANRFNAERGQPSRRRDGSCSGKGETQNIIAAVKQGLLHASMHEALTELEERNSTLEKEIAATRRGHGHHTLIAQMQMPNGRGSSQQRNRSKGRRSEA